MENIKVDLEPHPQGPLKYLIYLVLGAIFVFVAVEAKNALEGGGKDPIDRHTIVVSADAKRLAKPDIAIASFTVRKENASLRVAQEEASKVSNVAVEYLKQNGVEEKDIKTTQYNIYPLEKDNSPPCYPPYPPGGYVCPPRALAKTFVVEETFEVKMRSLDKVGDIIAAVSDKGINQIGSLYFTVDEPRLKQLREEARTEAITKAREEAKKLAGNLDVDLGDLISFSEGGGYPVYDRGIALGKGGAEAAPSAVPIIAPGESEIVASVSLVYEID